MPKEPPPKIRVCWGEVGPLDAAYHDTEWAVPCHDAELFERLMLEGFHAGLSWSTILAKRDNFRRAFDGWDAQRVAAYGEADFERLLQDTDVVRNRLKVLAATKNARGFLALQQEHDSFDRYIWSFVGGATPVQPACSPIPVFAISVGLALVPASENVARERRIEECQ